MLGPADKTGWAEPRAAKPVDLPYAAGKPLPKLGGPFKDVIHAAIADGSVLSMKRTLDENLLRLAITRNDNKEMDILKLGAFVPPPRLEPTAFIRAVPTPCSPTARFAS